MRHRRPIRTVATALLAAVTALVVALPSGAAAGEDPVQVIEDYCSPTGDVCLSAYFLNGKVKLQIAIERVSGRYELCVRGPKRKRCDEFKLRAGDEAIYSDRVDLRRKFGNQGPGRYKAVWKIEGDRVGEALRFRLRGM